MTGACWPGTPPGRGAGCRSWPGSWTRANRLSRPWAVRAGGNPASRGRTSGTSAAGPGRCRAAWCSASVPTPRRARPSPSTTTSWPRRTGSAGTSCSPPSSRARSRCRLLCRSPGTSSRPGTAARARPPPGPSPPRRVADVALAARPGWSQAWRPVDSCGAGSLLRGGGEPIGVAVAVDVEADRDVAVVDHAGVVHAGPEPDRDTTVVQPGDLGLHRAGDVLAAVLGRGQLVAHVRVALRAGAEVPRDHALVVDAKQLVER